MSLVKYPKTELERLIGRWEDLKSERQPWMNLWENIAKFTRPDAGNFFTNSNNQPKDHKNVYNGLTGRSIHELAAGLLSYTSSPAKPWFNLTLNGVDLNKDITARKWLSDVKDIIYDVMAKSNCYQSLQTMYEELATFGTAVCLVLEDIEDDIRLYPLTAGQYCIAVDDRNVPNTLFREYRMTVAELVQKYGIDKVSNYTRNCMEHNKLDEWITVIHAIVPRLDRDPTKEDNLNMPFASYVFEYYNNDNKLYNKNQEFLEVGGYPEFPALIARWNVNAGDIYGVSPCVEIYNDNIQLQNMEKRKLQGIDLAMNPPLQGPQTLRSRTINNLPGGYTIVDNTGTNPIKSLYGSTHMDLNYLLQGIEKKEYDIKKALHNDLFLMFDSVDRTMTATEVSERREQKMTMLGPVSLRNKAEIHDPLVKIVFSILARRGKFPPVPQNIANITINVEFVSLLLQAQKSTSLASIDRYLNVLIQMAQVDSTIMDTINFKRLAQTYSNLLDVPPDILNTEEEMQQIQLQRQQAQEAQMQAQQAQQQAMALRDTAQAMANISNSQDGFNTIQQMTGY